MASCRDLEQKHEEEEHERQERRERESVDASLLFRLLSSLFAIPMQRVAFQKGAGSRASCSTGAACLKRGAAVSSLFEPRRLSIVAADDGERERDFARRATAFL